MTSQGLSSEKSLPSQFFSERFDRKYLYDGSVAGTGSGQLQSMFSATFLKRYLVRVVKLMALVLICHQVFNAKMLGYSPKGLQQLYTTSSILLICSGIFNTYLLYSSLAGSNQRLWLYFHYIKSATTIIIFTPLIRTLPFSKKEWIDLQFYCVLVVLQLSPMARYYRECSVKRQLRRSQQAK